LPKKPSPPPEHPPYASSEREDPLKDPWKRLRERPGVRIIDTARRSSRER
jgi:hypothetical protein